MSTTAADRFLRQENWTWLLQWSPGKRLSYIILGIAALVGIVMLLLVAWIGDDAFVTFRVVDNFVNGYGFRWNPNERVQAYTNPLWMMLHIPFYFVWPNIFLLTFFLSLACSVASVAIVMRTFAKSYTTAVLFLIVPLLFSQAWMEYSMSGLENPLSHLLFALFGWVLICVHTPQRWFWLCFVASLAMLNRLDTILIYMPVLLYLGVKHRRDIQVKSIILGFLPIIAWLAFSLFYYGFLFPNTKYAKLNTGISAAAYWHQGVMYVKDLLKYHVTSSTLIVIGLQLGVWCGWRFIGKRTVSQKEDILFFLALGIAAYCFFIVSVGGDFMSGRFFTLPIFVSVWVIYALLPANTLIIYGIGAVFWLWAIQAYFQKESYMWHPAGIADERIFYFGGNALLRPDYSLRKDSQFKWSAVGREWHTDPPNEPRVVFNIGMFGYYGGLEVVLIDCFALSDPLLARLPITKKRHWRIGHFERDIPEGYKKGIMGDTSEMDSNLAQYYDKLHLIISGDLWDWERIKTIIAFNLGEYDHWRDNYIGKLPR